MTTKGTMLGLSFGPGIGARPLSLFPRMSPMSDPVEATEILSEVTGGSTSGVDRLFPIVYDELRRMAGVYMRNERDDHTLQPTALVHEVYMRLIDQSQQTWQNRAHFFAIAARAIRQILVDHARRRGRKKRGGGQANVPLEDALGVAVDDGRVDLVALSLAMEEFGQLHPEKERVIELRFFGGLTNEQVAEVMGVTTRTVERHWRFGRAWLFRALADEAGQSGERRET